MNITEICIRKPVLAWMLMAATVLFGLVAGQRVGISQFPDVDFPTISVSLTREGAAPEVMENDIVEIVEENLMQVEGVRNITSVSRLGSASVTLELDLSRNVDLAMQDVQTRLSQAQRRMPSDMEPPSIAKTNPEDNPILWVALSGPFSQQVLSDYARYRLKEKLQTVPGVGEITLGGYLERNVRVWVDARKLAERNLTVQDVSEALQKQHVELPAGRIETSGREIEVRVLGEALDLEMFRHIAIRGGASPVYLQDVALVEDGFEDQRRMSRVDGQPAQGLGVKKQRGANTVAVAQSVRTLLDEIQKSLPAGMSAGIMFDSSRFVEESVAEIEYELVLAVCLTALVCWMFLGSLSSTLNVILAIPMSLLGTVAVIWFLGFTLNTFSLLALSLAVGIVVDDAIMVMENIFRHAEQGADRVRAAREGTHEITFAALAATIAVVAIFLPVVFMEGVVGKFFLQFGITLSVAVMLSYLEAITLAPARCAQLLQTSRHDRGWLGRKVDNGFDHLQRAYAWLLERNLRRPWVALLVAALVMAASVRTFQNLPTEFVPSQDQSRIMIRLSTAVGSSLGETDRIMAKAEAWLATRPEVVRSFAVVGGFGGSGVNSGILFVTLKPPAERPLVPQSVFMAMVRKEFNGIPGLKAFPMDLSQSGFTAQRGFPVEFSVRGADWHQLVEASLDLTRKVQASGVVVDMDTDYQLGMPELRITPDRARASDVGVDISQVAQTVNALVGGVRVGKYNQGGRRVDVRMRLMAADRARPEDLGLLRLRNKSGQMIPLNTLVSTEERPALQAITRRDRERAISVYGNIAPGHSQDEALALVESLAKDLPMGTRVVMGGASVAFRESMSSLAFALVMGILVAYMVLGGQFNSFLHPVTVLTILPLSVAGAGFALSAGGYTLNIFSMIGLLLLMGIVKKNSILLVDYANQALEHGAADARAAMMIAGPTRLRPILMTSLATMAAAVPSAMKLGPGAEIRAPMAVAVIGGLVVSTALSLLVVPSFYVTADRARLWLAGLRRRKPALQNIPEPSQEL